MSKKEIIRTPKIEFDKTCFNPVHLPLIHDRNRYVIAYGGRDSAKSHTVAQKCLIHIMEEKYCKVVLIRKVEKYILGSQFDQIKDLINEYELNHLFKITERPIKIVYKPNPNNVIISMGLDDAERLKSLKDPTIAWYEEADQTEFNDFITFSPTIRSSKTDFLQEIFTLNSTDPKTWIQDYFFPDKNSYEKSDGDFVTVPSTKENTSIYHYTIYHNHFATDERIRNLENFKDISPDHYKTLCLGLWGDQKEGLIFEKYNVIKEFPEGIDYYFGLDYGFTNASALLKIGNKDNDLYWDEYIYQNRLTHPELCDIIDKEYKDEIKDTPIFVDSAEAGLVEELERRGYNVWGTEKGQGSVLEGIRLLQSFNHHITDHSLNIIQNFSNYVWKKDRKGNRRDEPVKFDDHAIDAGRGVAWSVRKYWKNETYEIVSKSMKVRPRGNPRNLRKSKYMKGE